MGSLHRSAAIVLISACALAGGAALARADEPFYRGKRLTVLINFAPGGPSDIEGRLLARHIVKYLDGQPIIIVQNKDGASGLVGSNFLGEVGPRDGTMFGYLTGAAWKSVIEPDSHRIDLKTYDFIAYQPGNAVYYMRADTEPGMKEGADIMRAKNLVAGGLSKEASKDLLMRLALDMLGVSYRYVTGYRSSSDARLAVQRGEIGMHAETTPAYFNMVEPSMVKTGMVIPLWYDPNYNGEAFSVPKVMENSLVPGFPDFYRKIKGTLPSGMMWDVYRTNLAVDSAMLRLIAMPPGSPKAAIDALRKAVGQLNGDKEFAEEALRTIQFVPYYETGADIDTRIRKALTVSPEIRNFVIDYVRKVSK
jgi:tripartite-type tricarboxylate transporter receptor subunit TctC